MLADWYGLQEISYTFMKRDNVKIVKCILSPNPINASKHNSKCTKILSIQKKLFGVTHGLSD